MSSRKQVAGILLTSALITLTGVYGVAQNDQTNTNVTVQSGALSLYAGDSNLNGDICTQGDIDATRTVESIPCDSSENSISLPNIFIQNSRQNPSTLLHDVIVEDLSGNATSSYTITAEVSNFVGTNNASNVIELGTNPDSASGLDAGEVTSVNVTDGGAGYTNNVTVAISAPASGTAAEAVAVVDQTGAISGINITSGGSGYTSSDTVIVTITDPAATAQATAEAYTINSGDNLSVGVVDSITVDTPGNSYTTAPDVTITGGGGSGASAVATLSGDGVGSIIITNPGTGYTSVPTVTFTPSGPGGGAAATAEVTVAGDPQDNIFVTLDPSGGTLKWLQPSGGDMTDFAKGPRSLVTNTTTQYTLFSTTTDTDTGRFGIDNVGFGLRVPAFVAADSYNATITQTVVN